MKKTFNILVINPGSTSTKVSLFKNADESDGKKIFHSAKELAGFVSVMDQVDYRAALVFEFLTEKGMAIEKLDAVIGRGGLLDPMEGGVYTVNAEMLALLKSGKNGRHASNLGAVLAKMVADKAGCQAFIADPVVVDELHDVSRLSGIPDLPRLSKFHALNHKASARFIASKIGKPYDTCRFIVAHLGGGISVGAHLNGRVIDVNNALDGEGPFSPERAGTLPSGQLLSLALHGGVEEQDLRRMLTGGGGMVAHCGTNDLEELTRRINAGDMHADLVIRAMAYQISKSIAGYGATFHGKVDRIILTGGMANNKGMVRMITERVEYLAPVEIVPGEREMESLAENAFLALIGIVPIKIYCARPN